MKSLRLLQSALSLATVVCFTIPKTASAQVANGGFETGDLSSWTSVDPSDFTQIGTDAVFAHSGNFYLNLGAGPALGSLSQTISTVPGFTYSLSFWLANDSNVPPNEFDVYWDGTLIFSLADAAASPYTNYVFSNLSASTAATTLEFRDRNDADYFRLDDVQVDVVPEPPAEALLLAGFVALAGYAGLTSRRRLKLSA